MKSAIVGIFEGLLGLFLLLVTALGLWVGGYWGGAREFNVVYGLLGAVVAGLGGVLVVGALYVLLEIRDLLRNLTSSTQQMESRQRSAAAMVAATSPAPSRKAESADDAMSQSTSYAPGSVAAAYYGVRSSTPSTRDKE